MLTLSVPLTRPTRTLGAACLVAAAWLAGCASPGATATATAAPLTIEHGTVLHNITVVDTRSGALHSDRAVLVEGGRIVQVLDAAAVRVAGSAQHIDGTGRYLVPGYLDMHVHTLAAPDAAAQWGRLLAHGVTGVRQMNGNAALLQAARQHNAQRAAGQALAPEVVQVTGDLFVGAPDAAAARRFVQQQQALGSDFLKVVGGSAPVVLAALDEARQRGLPVAGHLPASLGAVPAAQAGWRAVEHFGALPGLMLDCVRDEAPLRAALLGEQAGKPPAIGPAAVLLPLLDRAPEASIYQRIADSFDEAKCQQVMATLVQQGTWQVPTLIRLRTMLQAADPAQAANPALAAVPPPVLGLWQGLAQRYAATMPPEAVAGFARYYGQVQRLVGQLQRQGGRLLTGSDTGGIWVVPGSSLHQEFAELAAAGLSPLQVLQAATINGAQFLGRSATLGTVEAGRQADLVLLDANPLADVAHLGRISGLLVQGRYLDGEALARLRQPMR